MLALIDQTLNATRSAIRRRSLKYDNLLQTVIASRSNCQMVGMMMNVEDNGVNPLNVLKRKKEDCAEEQLEAEIKRVALNDESESGTTSTSVGSGDSEGRSASRISDGELLDNVAAEAETKERKSRQAHLRMLCLVKQASMVVGHRGETISRIKSLTNTRINVSENVRGVPERVVYVRGSCENVAKAFGMIVRSVNERGNEKYDKRLDDIPTTINLLISHHLMGVVIGKHGSRLKEVEELSAARLRAMPEQLMMSSDRILMIEGVADAIHIATFYVAQTILNCKDAFKFKKTIFYQPSPLYSVLLNGTASSMTYSHQQHHQYHPADKYRNGKRLPRSAVMLMVPATETNATTQPRTIPQRPTPVLYTAANAAIAPSFTPNFLIPNVRIIDGPVATPVAQTMAIVQQEIYIDESFVGNIIGKDGKHINSIKESTGCSIYIDDPVPGGALERKLTVRGTSMGSQAAIMLISNKIEIDKINKERKR